MLSSTVHALRKSLSRHVLFLHLDASLRLASSSDLAIDGVRGGVRGGDYS